MKNNVPTSIDVMFQDVGTTTSTKATTTGKQIDLGQHGVAIGNRTLSVRAIDHQHQLPKFRSVVEDLKNIREKYAPFIPQIRPWLVIVEVNMTDKAKNTECTGESTKNKQNIERLVQGPC